MTQSSRRLACGMWLALFTLAAQSAAQTTGPLADPNFFPLAVWLQNPAQAARYKEAGINTYVGLWRGPTEEQLATLKQHGLFVICSQNAAGLAHKDDPAILAWMHGDEPDNAQAIRDGKGKGWGPPILPSKIVEDYRQRKANDPTRPVLLNLGQGVAWDQYIGRGVRRNHPEDYPEYVQGCDIASFDIYPACHEHPEIAGKLWYVADGVSRLRKWAGSERRVWNCIECTHISNPNAQATPRQVKAEVWMSLVRGSQGIIYFVHEFKPRFVEAGLLADAEMLAEVTKVNRQIAELAPVLNGPNVDGLVTVKSASSDVPVEAIARRRGNDRYVFAVAMRPGDAAVTFSLAGSAANRTVEVLGEARTLPIVDNQFTDSFANWDVHLYRIRGE